MEILVDDNVIEIAGKSLSVLVSLAFASKQWLVALQKAFASVIVGHADWDPVLQPMVKAAFDTSRAGQPALELYLGTDVMGVAEYIPWTLLVKNWVDWNCWLRAAPLDDLPFKLSPRVLAWDAEFIIFPFELLEKIETDRGRLLVDTFLHQVNGFVAALQPKHGAAFANGPVVRLLSFLGFALKSLWRRRGGNTAAVRWLLSALTAPNTPIEMGFRQWTLHDGNLSQVFVRMLQQWLPLFFLGSNLPEYVIGQIYAIGDSNAPDMTLQLNLPPLLPLAVAWFGPSAPSAAWQRRLADVANAHITRVQDITDIVADPVLVNLMRAYWEPVHGRAEWQVYNGLFGFADVFEG